MTGFRGLSKIKHKKSRIAAFVAAAVVVLSGVILPLSNNASALRVDSLSKVQGPTKGGEEVVIKGEGFLKDGKEKITYVRDMIGMESGGLCSEIPDEYEANILWHSSPGSRFVLTESGTAYEMKTDGTLVNASSDPNIGSITIGIDFATTGILSSDAGDLYIVSCSDGTDEDTSFLLVAEVQNQSDEFSSGNGTISSSGLVKWSLGSDGSGEYQVSGLREGEKIVANLGHEGGNSFIIKTNFGRLLLINYDVFIDITDYVIDRDIIVASSYHPGQLVLSSGDVYTWQSGDTSLTLSGLLPGLDENDSLRQYYDGYFVTSNGILLRNVSDYSSGYVTELVNIPGRVDKLTPGFQPRHDPPIIHLADGTIYGLASYREINKFPISDDDALVNITGYENDCYLGTTRSGKMQSLCGFNYSGGSVDVQYIGDLNPRETVVSASSGFVSSENVYWINILTSEGRYLRLDYNPDENKFFNLVDLTDEISQNLPTVSIPQVSALFFGSAEVTDFEILDNFTIRARVPANARGAYGISMQSIASNTPILTSLNYEYINGENSEGSQNNGSSGSSTIISAPNTGFKR